jgi:hypothetical protein
VCNDIWPLSPDELRIYKATYDTVRQRVDPNVCLNATVKTMMVAIDDALQQMSSSVHYSEEDTDSEEKEAFYPLVDEVTLLRLVDPEYLK